MDRIDHETEEAVRSLLTLIASRCDMAGSRVRDTHRSDSTQTL